MYFIVKVLTLLTNAFSEFYKRVSFMLLIESEKEFSILSVELSMPIGELTEPDFLKIVS
jgi:hypothetical protein